MLQLENLRPWERVEMVVRRHWMAYLILGLFLWMGVFITITLYAFFGAAWWINLLNVCFWLIYSIFLYVQWLNQELDLYVITNHRIIWVEQKSFLDRTVSEADLADIQEVNSATKGFFANIFNYGTLSIQTSWNRTTLSMSLVPDVINKWRKVLNLVNIRSWKTSATVTEKLTNNPTEWKN